MKKKGFMITAIMMAVIFLSSFIYVFIGTKSNEKLMKEYLSDRGYTSEEIFNIEVHHSFFNILLSYNEWSIHVQYTDEPNATYIYTVKNSEVKDSGVSGDVDKEDLKHKE